MRTESELEIFPLHEAIKKGEIEQAIALIDQKADLNLTDKEGDTALQLAVKKEKNKIIMRLLKFNANITAFDEPTIKMFVHLTAKTEEVEVMEFLFESKADLGWEDKEGATPLHYAAHQGHLGMVEYLLWVKKSKINQLDKYSQSPLSVAIYSEKKDIVRSLIKHDADVNLIVKGGRTSLHEAVMQKEIKILELLINKNAKVNQPDLNGESPLYTAVVAKREMGIIRYLIDQQADINWKNQNNKTLLNLAIERGNRELIKLLIEEIGSIWEGEKEKKSKDRLPQRVKLNLDPKKYEIVLITADEKQKISVPGIKMFVQFKKVLQNQDLRGKPILIKQGHKIIIYGRDKKREWRLIDGLDASRFKELIFPDIDSDTKKDKYYSFPIQVKTGDDCYLHAILGNWDPVAHEFLCDDIKGAQKKIKDTILADDNKEPLRSFIMDGIKELVIFGHTFGESSRELTNNYKKFNPDKNILTIWQIYEDILENKSSIKKYIEKNHQLSYDFSFKDKFNDILKRDTRKLYRYIFWNWGGTLFFTNKKLDAYREDLYKGNNFNWESFISQQVKAEYANFILKSGDLVLPSTLKIIAKIFNKKINYYNIDVMNIPTSFNSDSDIISTVDIKFVEEGQLQRLERSNYRDKFFLLSSDKLSKELNEKIIAGGEGIYLEGEPALHTAIHMGNIEVMEALIEKKSDVNSLDENNYTPLMRAAISFNVPIFTVLSMITILIKSGASINYKNENEENILKIITKDYRLKDAIKSTANDMLLDEFINPIPYRLQGPYLRDSNIFSVDSDVLNIPAAHFRMIEDQDLLYKDTEIISETACVIKDVILKVNGNLLIKSKRHVYLEGIIDIRLGNIEIYSDYVVYIKAPINIGKGNITINSPLIYIEGEINIHVGNIYIIVAKGYDLALVLVKNDMDINRIIKAHKKNSIPILFKKENEFSIYGESPMGAWELTTDLDAKEFQKLQFKEELDILTKSQVQKEIYEEIRLKKGHQDSNQVYIKRGLNTRAGGININGKADIEAELITDSYENIIDPYKKLWLLEDKIKIIQTLLTWKIMLNRHDLSSIADVGCYNYLERWLQGKVSVDTVGMIDKYGYSTLSFQIKYTDLDIDIITDKPSPGYKLGEGGYGVVYLGNHKFFNQVAVKKLHTDKSGFSEKIQKKFLREASIMANTSLFSDYLVKLQGICMEPPCIVMEYMPGGDLDSYIKQNIKQNILFSRDDQYQVIYDIASGLHHLHEMGIYHRDLKSANVLLKFIFNHKLQKAFCQAKLCDFGLAETKTAIYTSNRIDQNEGIVGTVPWMAPELFSGGRHSQASDIFALGLLIFEVIYQTPYEEEYKKIYMEFKEDKRIVAKIKKEKNWLESKGVKLPDEKNIGKVLASLIKKDVFIRLVALGGQHDEVALLRAFRCIIIKRMQDKINEIISKPVDSVPDVIKEIIKKCCAWDHQERKITAKEVTEKMKNPSLGWSPRILATGRLQQQSEFKSLAPRYG